VAAVPGIDFVVVGHTGWNLESPEREGGAFVLEAFQQGKHLGRLDLHVVDGKTAFVDRGQRAQLLTIRADRQRQLADLRARAASDTQGQLKPFYEQQARALEEALARDDQQLTAQPAKVTGNWLESRIFPLDASVPDHPGLALLTNAYNQESQRRAQKGLPVGIDFRPAQAALGAGAAAAPQPHARPEPPEAPGSFTYAGTNACGACHPAALAHWAKTKHAHAVESLRKKGREKDPACIGCHVTGFLRPGGARRVDTALARYPEVGCESCHGPGLAHVTAEDKKKSTQRQAPEAVCRECHTPDQVGGEFNYALFLKAVLGPGHGAP
jgi:hypothetical protein